MVAMEQRAGNQRRQDRGTGFGGGGGFRDGFDGRGSTASSSASRIAYDWAIGCYVVLRTTLGDEISGTVFAFDQLTNCLTLREEGDEPGLFNYRVLKATYIKEVVSARRPTEAPSVLLPYFDLHEVFGREEAALGKASMDGNQYQNESVETALEEPPNIAGDSDTACTQEPNGELNGASERSPGSSLETAKVEPSNVQAEVPVLADAFNDGGQQDGQQIDDISTSLEDGAAPFVQATTTSAPVETQADIPAAKQAPPGQTQGELTKKSFAEAASGKGSPNRIPTEGGQRKSNLPESVSYKRALDRSQVETQVDDKPARQPEQTVPRGPQQPAWQKPRSQLQGRASGPGAPSGIPRPPGGANNQETGPGSLVATRSAPVARGAPATSGKSSTDSGAMPGPTPGVVTLSLQGRWSKGRPKIPRDEAT